MSVSIKQLKAFVAVVEENSFSLAAERLNATQSGMSMLVQNLELSIGKKLINTWLLACQPVVWDTGIQKW